MAADYSALMKQYPKAISKDELCRICHISKRKATWLMENGYIPYETTGHQTHKYRIKMADVIRYLKSLENPENVAPKGIFSSRSGNQTSPPPAEKNNFQLLKKFLKQYWKDAPDALTPTDVCGLTGYTRQTVGRWIKNKKIKFVITQSGTLIAKDWLVEFISEYTIQNPSHLSNTNRQIALRYLEQQ